MLETIRLLFSFGFDSFRDTYPLMTGEYMASTFEIVFCTLAVEYAISWADFADNFLQNKARAWKKDVRILLIF